MDSATAQRRADRRGLQAGPRERRVTAIVVATDLLAWKLLRHDTQLDRRAAESVVVEMLQSLAAGTG